MTSTFFAPDLNLPDFTVLSGTVFPMRPAESITTQNQTFHRKSCGVNGTAVFIFLLYHIPD